MAQFDGYLFSKLHLIGSKSEGPAYYLQQFDYRELLVVKKVYPWEEDPQLHPHLNTKVSIEGVQTLNGIEYEKIGPYKPGKREEEERRLEVELAVDPNPLWINAMPGGPNPPSALELTLRVRWPYRSIWEGVCPTSQFYDFWVEHDGKEIWRWSADKHFKPVVSQIAIPGGDFHEFPEIWKVGKDDVPGEGTYVAKTIFIASGQEAESEFEIKFAQ